MRREGGKEGGLEGGEKGRLSSVEARAQILVVSSKMHLIGHLINNKQHLERTLKIHHNRNLSYLRASLQVRLDRCSTPYL